MTGRDRKGEGKTGSPSPTNLLINLARISKGTGMAAVIQPVIGERVYLANTAGSAELMEEHPDWHFFWDKDLVYVPFCDDFGPFNLADIHHFVQVLHQKLQQYSNKTIVYCVDGNAREICNAVFLAGCYLIMTMGLAPDSVLSCFEAIISTLPAYRDASYGVSDFDLHLMDCWRALHRALQLGWLAEYDMAEYIHYDNVLEGDLHFIIPAKLIAMKGPKSLPNGQTYLDKSGRRTFAPNFYLEPFADMGVTTIVRLNEREYADAEFEQHGLHCVALDFDGSTPTPDVVLAFLHTARRAPGAIAVHCKAGLGRTGTLIALFLMESYGFTAREAIAWVRIVRPGSILGDQQHFLASIEDAAAQAATMQLAVAGRNAPATALRSTAASQPSSPREGESDGDGRRAGPAATAAAAGPALAEDAGDEQEEDGGASAPAAAVTPAGPRAEGGGDGGGDWQRKGPAAQDDCGSGGGAAAAAARRGAAFERALFRTVRWRRRFSDCGGTGGAGGGEPGRMRLQSSY